MAQIVDYVNIRDTLITTLVNANTTTATIDLSNSLTSRVKNITARDLEIEPVMITEYPYIGVEFISKNEELAEYGSSIADRAIDINLNINCVYDNGAKASTADNLMLMVRNVEAVLRNNLSLGNYYTAGASVVSVVPTTTEFKTTYGAGNSPYNRSATIQTVVRVHSKNV